jgi:predicted dehydrogenase/aryl-alcohol dehydrogenase-like predicted oxidoreductase
MTQKIVNWGIIGPGAIANNFADGLAQSTSGKLVAIASHNSSRRQNFGNKYAIAENARFNTYEDLANSSIVDAVYISTPHPMHANLTIMALRAGKHVLVEKPGGMSLAEVVAVQEVATQENRLWMEAYMYRCHPQIARLLEIIASGEIGAIHHITTRFGFAASFDATSRLFDPALGGGGILDVGGYPISLVRLIAGAAINQPFAEPTTFKATGLLGKSGVDEVAFGLLTFANGITAEIACAVVRNMHNNCVIEGENGIIELVDPWVPGRNAGPSDATINITVNGKTRSEVLRDPKMLFAFEAEEVSRTILRGDLQGTSPAMSWADSRGNAAAQDKWRQELGYVACNENPATPSRFNHLIPQKHIAIPHTTLPGLNQPISRLVIGCDNKDDVGSGAIIWDAWMDAGGNAFDTGFVYGGGNHERVLGQWIKARKVEKNITVIVKGAHTPYCLPGAITAQFNQSLERLQISHAPIYIMHRDNLDVPVGEFVEELHALKTQGLIGIWGGSNWSIPRFVEAVDYAKKHKLTAPSLLNNNLSLAVMEKPVWQGCVTSNTAETLKFLRSSNTIHLSWSSQARGYFLPEDLRNRLPEDTSPETCFGSVKNAERRRRAEAMAKERGVSAHNIATAWVLAQSFPSLALVGPRSPGEIVSTLPGLNINLTADEVAYLNLES